MIVTFNDLMTAASILIGVSSLIYTIMKNKVTGPVFNFPVGIIRATSSDTYPNRSINVKLLIQNQGDRMGYLWITKIVCYYNGIKTTPINIHLPQEHQMQRESQTQKGLTFILPENMDYNNDLFNTGYLIISAQFAKYNKIEKIVDLKVEIKELNICL